MIPEDLLPDCCLIAIGDIRAPALAQTVRCERNHYVTYISSTDGWRSSMARRQPAKPPDVRRLTQLPHGPYSTQEAIVAAGTTYRKADYWCRLGWVDGQPTDGPGSGAQRRFTAQQVQRLCELEFVSKLKAMSHPELVEYIRTHFAFVRPVGNVPVQEGLL